MADDGSSVAVVAVVDVPVATILAVVVVGVGGDGAVDDGANGVDHLTYYALAHEASVVIAVVAVVANDYYDARLPIVIVVRVGCDADDDGGCGGCDYVVIVVDCDVDGSERLNDVAVRTSKGRTIKRDDGLDTVVAVAGVDVAGI